MRKYLFIMLFLGSLFPLAAQQTPGFSHYFKNPYLINPATAGLQPYSQIMLLYRQQWLGVEGAPATQALTFTSPLNHQRMGVGLYVYNDVANILGRTGAMASYRYTVPLARHHQLSLGLAAGLADNRIYFDRVRAEDPYESALLRNVESGAHADGSFGLLYGFKKLQLGFSAQQIFENRLSYENNADEKRMAYNLIRHYNITAAYSFFLSESLSLDPYVLLKSAQGLPLQYDINAIIKYKEDSWLGLSYRGNTAAVVSLGTDFDERFTIGYAFEVPVNALKGVSGSTHEVMVGFRFGRSSSGNGASAGGAKPANEKLQKAVQEQYEQLDQLQQGNEVLKTEVQQNKEIINKQKEEIDELRKTLKEDQEEIRRVIDQVKVSEEPENLTGNGEYYAVIGAFKTLKYAKIFQKVIQRELQTATSVVQSRRISGVDYYFVYTKSFSHFREAQSEINRLSKQDSKGLISGNPWIYELEKPE